MISKAHNTVKRDYWRRGLVSFDHWCCADKSLASASSTSWCGDIEEVAATSSSSSSSWSLLGWSVSTNCSHFFAFAYSSARYTRIPIIETVILKTTVFQEAKYITRSSKIVGGRSMRITPKVPTGIWKGCSNSGCLIHNQTNATNSTSMPKQ